MMVAVVIWLNVMIFTQTMFLWFKTKSHIFWVLTLLFSILTHLHTQGFKELLMTPFWRHISACSWTMSADNPALKSVGDHVKLQHSRVSISYDRWSPKYRQTFNISRTSVGNKTVDHSNVVQELAANWEVVCVARSSFMLELLHFGVLDVMKLKHSSET